MALSSQPYKGTRDYYPEQKRLQNYVFSVWRTVVERFGYQEYGAPLMEPLELYAAKSGQELVNEQTYSLVDRGGRTVAIRPEMTPTISRLVAARRQELAYPVRLYSIANFMRYERPQRGREREFWQLNFDLFGADGPAADAETVIISDAILKAFGASNGDYEIKVNSRQFINFMMAHYFGLDETASQQLIKLFDRKAKITADDFADQLRQIVSGQYDDTAEKVARIIDARSLDDLPAELTDTAAAADLRHVFDHLAAAGVTAARFDASLMRGFDYYTGTVFEVFDTHPDNNRSLFGGGRYDGLVGLFDVEPISAVGAAPGGTTMEQFLTAHDLVPEFPSSIDVYVAVIGQADITAQTVASQLRAKGLAASVDYSGRKLDKQIKTADKLGVTYLLVVGGNDQPDQPLSLKDLTSGQTDQLTVDQIVTRLHA